MRSVRAVLVMDLCGFSEMMEAEGDIAARSRVNKFRLHSRGAVVAYSGVWIKSWADNFAAVFPTVTQAVECANTLFQEFRSAAGIGYGELYVEVLGGHDLDLWGVEMNRACKLGEDRAGPSEILFTLAAEAQLERERAS